LSRFLILLICLLANTYCFADAYCDGKILRWVDGDTLTVYCKGRGKTRVRLVGVDTPESRDNLKLSRDLSKRPELSKAQVLNAGKRAKEFVETLCPAETPVSVEIDSNPKDSYDRVLGFVFCNEHFVNAELVRKGLAIPYSVAPNTLFAKDFEGFGKEAAEKGVGLWAEHIFQVKDIERSHTNGAHKRKNF
jgi:micrococcal nuclease